MKVLYHSEFDILWPDYGILIPVSQSRASKVYQRLCGLELGTDWHYPGPFAQISREDLERVHANEFVKRLYSDKCDEEVILAYELRLPNGQWHRYDPGLAKLPLSKMFERSILHCRGTYQACLLALETGSAYFLGGGMHHAGRASGRGFCLVNDIVIALKKCQAQGLIQNAWVIDVDAHQGDGTAELTMHDTSIQSLSIHMARGWPIESEVCFNSDLDIPIEIAAENDYLPRLEEGLHQLASLGSADLALIVNGADPAIDDGLESTKSLQLTHEQLLERDLMIYSFLQKNSIPQAYVMAGGYGENSYKVYTAFLGAVLESQPL